jgi:pimeloyl-ACP methyl ester carboxylesterase
MGGIAAMELAFHYPERLAGLIVEDIAPRPYQSTSGDILAALAEIDLSAVTSREQAEVMLAPKIKSGRTRQFALTNLVRREDHTLPESQSASTAIRATRIGNLRAAIKCQLFRQDTFHRRRAIGLSH